MVELRPSKPMMRVRSPSAAFLPVRRGSIPAPVRSSSAALSSAPRSGAPPSAPGLPRTRSCGGQRPGPVVEPAVEREHRAGERAAERRGEQRDQPAVFVAPRRAAAAARSQRRSPQLGRVLAQRLGREAPDRDRRDRHAIGGPRSRKLARERLDRRPRGAGVGHRRHPVMRRHGHVDDHPAAGRAASRARRRPRTSPACRRR